MKDNEKLLNLKTLNLEDSNDRLIYGITHDFNNLITQIYTNLEVVLLDNELKSETKETITNAITSLDQAVELLEKLKTISRPINNKEYYIDPVVILCDLIKKIKGTSNLKIDVENSIVNNVSVKIDRTSFTRVIENIIDNAIYACSFAEKPEIFISLNCTSDYLEILIEDSGEGIPNHLASFIFNPYFTTKKNNIGSGVGLSISKTLITSVGGTLELSRDKKRLSGAGFVLTLPLSAMPPTIEFQEKNFNPEDLAGKKLFICAEDRIIKNHLFILNKLKADCHHFTPQTLPSNNFAGAQVVIISLSEEVAKFGIVRFIKAIPTNLPVIIISSDLESSSYLNELQRSNLHILDLPITFNIFAKTILKLINSTKL